MTSNRRRRTIEQAYKAAVEAANAKRKELEAQGAQYEAYETVGLSDNPKPGGKRYEMLDLCGRAWLVVNGRSSFYKVLKALYQAGDRRFYVGTPRHIGINAYRGQEVSCHEAATKAFADVLNAADQRVNARVSMYLD